MVPDDWSIKKLGDVSVFVTSGSRGWAPYYAEDGNRFIRITNLTRGQLALDLSDLKHVQLPDGSSEGQRTRLSSGDILISITADLGLIGFIDEIPPKPTYINQHIALVRPDRHQV